VVLARPSAPKHGERKGVDDDAGTGCCGAGQGPKGRRRWVESDKLARTLLVSRAIRTTTTQPSAPKGWREGEREREREGEPEVSEYVCVSVCVCKQACQAQCQAPLGHKDPQSQHAVCLSFLIPFTRVERRQQPQRNVCSTTGCVARRGSS